MTNKITKIFTLFLTLTILSSGAIDMLAGSKDGKSGDNTVVPASFFLNKTQEGTSEAKVFETAQGTQNITFENPYNPGHNTTTWGGTFRGEIDGEAAYFYCIDLSHQVAFYKSTAKHKYTDAGSTSKEITYILNNYYPYVPYPYQGSASSEGLEAGAIQLAIWHYADGVNVQGMANSNVRTRALQIISDTDQNAQLYTPLETLLLVPASQTVPYGTDGSFFVSTFNVDGQNLAGINVTLSATSGTLSETSITTGSSGSYGPITIQKGSSDQAEITATANVVVPQGTRYVHVNSPGVYQKLVLATPAGIQRRVAAVVNWYQQGNDGCNLNGYYTLTQGGWGSSSNSTPGQIRDQYFHKVFPSGLIVGTNKTLILNSATAVKDFLPSGGTASALTQNWTDPGSSLNNVLAGQAVALTLNVKFDEAGKIGTNPVNIGELVILGGAFDGMSVNDFLVIVNKAFGGENTGYSLTAINEAATAINENFVEGLVDGGFLTCEPEECFSTIGDYVWHDRDLDGKQDSNEPGIPDVTVQLIYDGDVVSSTTTDNNGKYEFTNLAKGNYTVKIADSNFEEGGPLNNWYATKQNQGSDDTKDSDGDKTNHSANVAVNCEDDLTIDFGFFLVCLEFEKTGPDTVKPGDQVTYEFTVHNCGDVTLGGGVTVYDSLLNPVGNHQIWYKTVNPGETYTFTKTYTAKEEDCGALINIAKAIGHPANVSWSNAQEIIVYSSWTTFVDCEEECVGQIGNRVWLDYSNEGGENNCNGLQDANEPGIPNVKVILKDAQGNELTNMLTNNLGEYLFSDLCDATYIVEVDVTTLPETYTPAPTNVGDNRELDSNNNPFTVTLSEGNRINLSVDFGYCVEEEKEADLRIKKEASDTNPENGDQITYTITVTNDGPSEADNVQAYDLLPSGLIFESATASQGAFDQTSGYWTIGTLASGASAILGITVTVDIDEVNTSYFDLGPATGFNVFVWKDVDQPSSDTEGKMAVGRNATLGWYSVGDKLDLQTPPEDVLIVGNNLTYTSGAIYNGNVVYGNSTNLPVDAVSFVDGTLRQDTPIDFNAAKSYLQSLSNQLAGYTTNGTNEEPYASGLILTGNDPFLNVFSVSGTLLSGKTDVQIQVPNGSVVLVNINGNNVSMSGGLEVTGTDVGNVLYNFYEATNISIQGIDVRGSILAPWAEVNFSSGVQNGQMIAMSVVGSGQFNNHLFVGNIPTTTQITNCAEVGFSVSTGNTDPNPDNNSDCVTITVGYEPNSGGQSGGSTGGTWEPAATFGITEIVYAMANDADGNILAGTWGGKIYRNVEGNWTIINAGMGVAFIWDIEVTDYGYIFVATEKGVFLSTNNGVDWSLVGLSGNDVRDLEFDSNGFLYAGTWGVGVFKSEDDGTTWTELSDGLTNLAVNSLAITSNGDIFAATFGTGIAKLEHGTTTWTQLANSYFVVWTLAASQDDKVYAGTYGDGLHVSSDFGATWTKVGNSPATYIYSLVFDASDNLYVSSWTAGVYVLSSSESAANFQSVGMSGAGVSTVFVDKVNSSLYVGTKSGQIYEYVNATDIEEPADLPTEFALEQNYPNPFNPTTNIKFSVINTGNYSLKVYNILGEEVVTLINNQLNPGNYTVTFDASKLSSGIYIYHLSGSNLNMVKKMMLMK